MTTARKEDLTFAKVFAAIILFVAASMYVFGVSGWGWPLLGLILVGPMFGLKEGDEVGKPKSGSDGAISAGSSDSGGCDGC